MKKFITYFLYTLILLLTSILGMYIGSKFGAEMESLFNMVFIGLPIGILVGVIIDIVMYRNSLINTKIDSINPSLQKVVFISTLTISILFILSVTYLVYLKQSVKYSWGNNYNNTELRAKCEHSGGVWSIANVRGAKPTCIKDSQSISPIPSQP